MIGTSTLMQAVALGIVATSGAAVASQSDVWRLTAFLALGSSLGVLWSCLSKESKEEGRMTKARILAGAMSGVALPRFVERAALSFGWAWFDLNMADPLAIIGVGFVFAVAGFYIVHSTLRRIEKKERQAGNFLAGAVEKTLTKGIPQFMPGDDDKPEGKE